MVAAHRVSAIGMKPNTALRLALGGVKKYTCIYIYRSSIYSYIYIYISIHIRIMFLHLLISLLHPTEPPLVSVVIDRDPFLAVQLRARGPGSGAAPALLPPP